MRARFLLNVRRSAVLSGGLFLGHFGLKWPVFKLAGLKPSKLPGHFQKWPIWPILSGPWPIIFEFVRPTKKVAYNGLISRILADNFHVLKFFSAFGAIF